MEINNYSIPYTNLEINPIDFQYNSTQKVDSFILSELNNIIKQGDEWISPKACVWITDDCIIHPEKIIIKNTIFNCGKKICTQLQHAERIAIFIATVGNGTTEKYQHYKEQEDYLNAFFIDELGSIAVEKTMDIVQKSLTSKLIKEGVNLSNRYSPGYCDWHVSEQQKIFSVFPTETHKVKLSKSSLMTPIKSISGIMGIGKKIRFIKHNCSLCKLKKCLYRKQN